MPAATVKAKFTQKQLDGMLDKSVFSSNDIIKMGLFNNAVAVSKAVTKGDLKSDRLIPGSQHVFTKENLMEYCKQHHLMSSFDKENNKVLLESISESIRFVVDTLIDIEEQMDVLYYTSATEK